MSARIAVQTAQALLWITLAACSGVTAVQERAVHFSNGGVTLAGSLFLPGNAGRYPAVVLFHGSGPQTRDRSMARWFAEQGAAALAYDKRGAGESTGDFRRVPFMDLADDGLAAVAFLKAQNEIDTKRIGVWGASQGGWLGPLAASKSTDIAFVIAVSGPGVSPDEQMVFYYANQLRDQGLSESEIAAASVLRRQVWRYLATGSGYREAKTALAQARSTSWFKAVQGQQDGLFKKTDSEIFDDPGLRSNPWFRSEVNYDPRDALRKLAVPGLFLFGEKDELVPVAKSVEIIRATLSERPNHDFTIKVFPGADHSIHVTGPDGPMNYASGYLDMMRDWLRAKRMIQK